MPDDHSQQLAWTKLDEETYKAGYRKLIRRKFQFPNGQIEEFDLYHDGDVATCVALTADNQVITAKHYRPGPERVFNDLIGGFIDHGESAKDAISRELLEEAGYVGEETEIGISYFSAYSTGKKHIFIVKNCQKTQEPQLETTEYLDIEIISLKEFKRNALAGKMVDVDAALLALHHLGQL